MEVVPLGLFERRYRRRLGFVTVRIACGPMLFRGVWSGMPISPYVRWLRDRVGHERLLLPSVSVHVFDDGKWQPPVA